MTWFDVDSGLIDSEGFTNADGTTVTAAASLNTKGNWAQLSAATPFPSRAIRVNCCPGASTGAGEYLLDIGIGPSGSETVILPNIFYAGTAAANNLYYRNTLWPVSIPKGVRLAARLQSTLGSNSFRVSADLLSATALNAIGSGGCDQYGASTSISRGTQIDPGSTANSFGSWVQMSASTPMPCQGLKLMLGSDGGTTKTAFRCRIQIGIGPPGSEVPIGGDAIVNVSSSALVAPAVLDFPGIAVPKGSRLCIRAMPSASIGTSGSRVIDAILYGFYA